MRLETRLEDLISDVREALCSVRSDALATFVASVFLVVRPGAPSSFVAPSSDVLCS